MNNDTWMLPLVGADALVRDTQSSAPQNISYDGSTSEDVEPLYLFS